MMPGLVVFRRRQVHWWYPVAAGYHLKSAYLCLTCQAFLLSIFEQACLGEATFRVNLTGSQHCTANTAEMKQEIWKYWLAPWEASIWPNHWNLMDAWTRAAWYWRSLLVCIDETARGFLANYDKKNKLSHKNSSQCNTTNMTMTKIDNWQ